MAKQLSRSVNRLGSVANRLAHAFLWNAIGISLQPRRMN
jgi:hypothetical protein